MKTFDIYAFVVLRMLDDKRITTGHVSILAAIFYYWQQSGFSRPYSISRKKVMAVCKMVSFSTYHKKLNQLQEFGYINISPSYHPQHGTTIDWNTGSDDDFAVLK